MTYQPLALQTDERLTEMPSLGSKWRLGFGSIAFAISIALALFAVLITPAQASPLTSGLQRMIPNGNLHLEPGQEIDDDVIVFSGNVTLDKGAKITGDLLVMSGNIEISEEAIIKGDVATFSGNIDLYGVVEGDIAAVSGNIDLYDGAKVEGDISVVSGNLTREENTEVEGETVSGQNFDFGGLFGFADSEVAEEIRAGIEAEIEKAVADESSSEREPSRGSERGSGSDRSGGGGIGAMIAGIFGAFFSTLVLAILAGLVAFLRPSIIKSVQRRFKNELALCFGAGLIVNIGGFLIAGVMAITIIGLLVAIPAWIALVILNIAGGIIAAAALGERVANYLNLSSSYPIKIAAGAAVLILAITLLWSMGSCFSFIGFLGFFLLSSIGTGALVLPWVRRFMGDEKSSERSSNEQQRNDGPSRGDNNDTQTENDASVDDAEEMKPSESEESPAEAPTKSEPAVEAPKAKPQKQAADNFTKIRGIGAVFAARLADADITSYAQLASMTADEIGEIFGWPAERVERDNIIEQAAAFADE